MNKIHINKIHTQITVEKRNCKHKYFKKLQRPLGNTYIKKLNLNY